MHSAFLRGVELLNQPELDSVQSPGQTVDSPRKSAPDHMGGIDGVPKNVTQLKPVMDKLMRKVTMITIWSVSANVMQDLPKGADQQWLTAAKQHTQWVRGHVSNEEEKLKELLTDLEANTFEDSQEE